MELSWYSVTGVALLLSGDAVSVREVDLGLGLFHDGVDVLTSATDDVRVDGETHFHRHFHWIKLAKRKKKKNQIKKHDAVITEFLTLDRMVFNNIHFLCWMW